MNERIKELYIETSNETADGKEWAIGGMKNAEKFAELIVRECAQLVEDNMDPQNAWITPGYVKQHFGVEE